jgi:hypothetical protein
LLLCRWRFYFGWFSRGFDCFRERILFGFFGLGISIEIAAVGLERGDDPGIENSALDGEDWIRWRALMLARGRGEVV